VRDGTADRLHVDLSERRHDLRHDVPVPFASDPSAGYGADHRRQPTGPADLGSVVKARAIQCALSRVCGLCGLSLATGPAAATTFVGSVAEADDNTFVFPPMHPDCAELALETYPALHVPVLGQRLVLAEWAVVVTGGFELERPAERGAPVLFHPNSVSSRATVMSRRGDHSLSASS
jgi:hypothetical protein